MDHQDRANADEGWRLGWVATHEDITAKRRAKALLVKLEARLPLCRTIASLMAEPADRVAEAIEML
jgi:hypothetical protein